MKGAFVFSVVVATGVWSMGASAQTSKIRAVSATSKNLYLDVHHLGTGKVTAKDVAAAHQKDLAVEKKYGVKIIKYWFDEKRGDVYCLASAPDSESLLKTHAEAHGLLPDKIREVTSGKEEALKGKNNLYLDIHELGAGNVTAKAVAEAHKKDLAVEKKHGVNLINYWVDEKNGTVMCLAQAPNADSLVSTHKEAHGLIPLSVMKVRQGQ
jgi:hypothetical protein